MDRVKIKLKENKMKKHPNLLSIILIIISVLTILAVLTEYILIMNDIIDETHFLYFTLLVSSLSAPTILFLIGAITYKSKEKK